MEKIKKITFKGYKVFSDKAEVCIDGISRVNVIIGKNNSGKTSLLDIVELIYDINTKTVSKSSISNIGFTLPQNLKVFVYSRLHILVKSFGKCFYKKRECQGFHYQKLEVV